MTKEPTVTMTKKQTVTHVLVLIDMSGSMWNLAADVRGGFNAFIESLRADERAAVATFRLTVTLFDTDYVSHAVDVALSTVADLTEANYSPRGMTALNDAIGKTISDFEAKHGKIKKSERVLMVINTDGRENASREYSTDAVKTMIKVREASGRWGFIYLGAGLDAFERGHDLGMINSLATVQSGAGTRSTWSGLASAGTSYASGQSASEVFTTLATTEGVADPEVTP